MKVKKVISAKYTKNLKANIRIEIIFAGNYLELIQEKDEVIEELQKQLEEMDHKYIQDQILHREDINILTKRINEHFDIMQNAYRKHLKLIEARYSSNFFDNWFTRKLG